MPEGQPLSYAGAYLTIYNNTYRGVATGGGGISEHIPQESDTLKIYVIVLLL